MVLAGSCTADEDAPRDGASGPPTKVVEQDPTVWISSNPKSSWYDEMLMPPFGGMTADPEVAPADGQAGIGPAAGAGAPPDVDAGTDPDELESDAGQEEQDD